MLNYHLRRTIKGIQHSHTESQNLIPGKAFQPVDPFHQDTPQYYFATLCFTSKNKRSHDMICLMSSGSFWKCKCETHLHCCHSFPHSVFVLPLILCWFIREREKKTRTKSQENQMAHVASKRLICCCGGLCVDSEKEIQQTCSEESITGYRI